MVYQDITGIRSGRLVAVSYSHKSKIMVICGIVFVTAGISRS